MTGRIFNIQHFSTMDGPGVRTVVFFKGCNMSCKWCHNPESLSSSKQLMFYEEKCIGCGRCIDICRNNCHIIDDDGRHILDISKCNKCFECVNECFADALVITGEDVEAQDVIDEILKNKLYFDNSDGGVTFSGGECMLQLDFLLEILKACKDSGIHTAIDTAGYIDYSDYERVIPYTDLFLYDIKSIDNDIHKSITGVGNKQILENFKRLYKQGCKIEVRVPFIPGYNDEQIDSIGQFLSDYNVSKVLLPYHALGDAKYESLSKDVIKIESIKQNDDKIQRLRTQYNFK